MRIALLISLVLLACGTRPNRACIIATNALKVVHKDGSCESVSLGENTDFAIWRFDDGERLCHDAVGAERALPCTVLQPTKDELAADAKTRAEAEAKAKMEAEAKAKVEAEAKARADADAKAKSQPQAEAVGSGSAKGPSKP